MVSVRALALASVAVAALSGAASAADLLPPPPMEAPAPFIAPDASGWYLRGDVGMGLNSLGGPSTSPSPLNGVPIGTGSDNWYNSDLSASGLFDVGVGYQVNNWFRADVTGELRGGAEFSALEVLNVNNGTANGPQTGDFYRGHLSTALAMVNGYVDLGNWYGISPFVGAGVGVAFNRMSGMTDNGVVSPTGTATGAAGGVLGANTTTSLAWALMAGLDMNITRNLKLELGYRYLNYGSFRSGPSSCMSGNGAQGSFSVANCGGAPFTVGARNLASNDFRVGLLYYFDAPRPAPMYEQPLVRKY